MVTAAKRETQHPVLRAYGGSNLSVNSSAAAAGMISCYTRRRPILPPPRLATISILHFFLKVDRFAVVEFPEEDCSLAVVHGSWLNEKRNKTFWPTLKNPSQRRRATVEGAAPSPSWTQANCVVVQTPMKRRVKSSTSCNIIWT